MADQDRSLEFDVEVQGTPDEVWRAIATGPGISSWYVPHTVEEREGGAAIARFGPGPEMEVPGRVAAWEPPTRVVFDGGDPDEGLAFEWTVEPSSGDTCTVRLMNTGFGSGDEWDAQYDGMAKGWELFLLNLQLHMQHFAGRTATPALPMAMWAGQKDELWAKLAESLGFPATPSVGQRVELAASDDLKLAGDVVDVGSWRLALLVDEPAPGTAFIALEGADDHIGVSIWSYLYGDEGAAAAGRDEARWQAWLSDQAE